VTPDRGAPEQTYPAGGALGRSFLEFWIESRARIVREEGLDFWSNAGSDSLMAIKWQGPERYENAPNSRMAAEPRGPGHGGHGRRRSA